MPQAPSRGKACPDPGVWGLGAGTACVGQRDAGSGDSFQDAAGRRQGQARLVVNRDLAGPCAPGTATPCLQSLLPVGTRRPGQPGFPC